MSSETRRDGEKVKMGLTNIKQPKEIVKNKALVTEMSTAAMHRLDEVIQTGRTRTQLMSTKDPHTLMKPNCRQGFSSPAGKRFLVQV